MKKIRLYLVLLAKLNLFQKIFVTILNKFFGFLRGLKYRLYIALEKVGCYVVCEGPPFKRTLEKGPFFIAEFPTRERDFRKRKNQKKRIFLKNKIYLPQSLFLAS